MVNTTWNPSDKTTNTTLSGGNLTAAFGAGTNGVRSIDRQISGKYYWEVTTTGWTGSTGGFGFCTVSTNLTLAFNAVGNQGVVVNANGQVLANGTIVASGLGTSTTNMVVCFALDLNAKRLWVRYTSTGNWNGNASYDPVAGIGGADISMGMVAAMYLYAGGTTAATYTLNVGDTAFSGTVPSGFTAGFPTGTPTLIAADTQTALEQWGDGNPVGQLTQIGVEMWSSAGSGTVQGILTQIGLEQWAQVIATGGLMKVWTGSAWVEKPMKIWTGAAWVAKPVKFWNGTSWVLS